MVNPSSTTSSRYRSSGINSLNGGISDHLQNFELMQFDRNAKNTIHIDDLSRNFALNPGEGLKIHPFKDAHSTQAMQDRELEKLSRYLLRIAAVPDFRTVNHKVGARFDPTSKTYAYRRGDGRTGRRLVVRFCFPPPSLENWWYLVAK